MASKNETVADIVADMRDALRNENPWGENDTRTAWINSGSIFAYLDRIEAAWKRDEERAVEHATRHAEAVARDNCRDCVHNPNGKNYEVGNAAAMREALEFIKLASDDYEKYGNTKAGALDVIYEKACAALAAPARQCDIGTAEEQKERFDEFCNNHWGSNDRSGNNCGMCPLSPINCLLEWAQMPYEAEEGGAQ